MSHKPMVLTNREHRELHVRWERHKELNPQSVRNIKNWFELAESSVQAFGSRVDAFPWINMQKLQQTVYGSTNPIYGLLDAMDFPDHLPPIVDRLVYADKVASLIREHEEYGSSGSYMPRSVILGWICRQHDLILGDVRESA